MGKATAVLLGGSLAVEFFLSPSASAFFEDYACPCEEHTAGARGTVPCSLAESSSYCEIVYGLAPVHSPEAAGIVVSRLDFLSNELNPPHPFILSPQRASVLILQIIPADWPVVPQSDEIASYIVTYSVLPLVYQDADDDTLLNISERLMNNMPSILNLIGQSEPLEIDDGLTVGSGCLTIRSYDVRVAFNSGWHARIEGWSCAWIDQVIRG